MASQSRFPPELRSQKPPTFAKSILLRLRPLRSDLPLLSSIRKPLHPSESSVAKRICVRSRADFFRTRSPGRIVRTGPSSACLEAAEASPCVAKRLYGRADRPESISLSSPHPPKLSPRPRLRSTPSRRESLAHSHHSLSSVLCCVCLESPLLLDAQRKSRRIILEPTARGFF